ncbi:MAG: 1-deoxy-D-xylulose-5-phosphate reductoisomerase, partial [Planctomycetota bacterium]|nr:1-deoxy-D-xylulose-5-phosphate reductoisomerase [Planctomycetota bacterium]
MKNLCILGSTGSIGVSTLRVVAQFPEKFRVRSMTAGRNVRKLAEQVRVVRPDRVAIADKELVPEFKRLIADGVAGPSSGPTPKGTADRAPWRGEVLGGTEALVELAEEKASDYVVSAIVGAAG